MTLAFRASTRHKYCSASKMGADARNGLLDAVRAARDADPGIGAKALARKLDVACKEVRDALSEISSNVTPSVAAPATTKLAATAPAASAPSYGATVQPHPQGNDRNCWGCGAVAFANKSRRAKSVSASSSYHATSAASSARRRPGLGTRPGTSRSRQIASSGKKVAPRGHPKVATRALRRGRTRSSRTISCCSRLSS